MSLDPLEFLIQFILAVVVFSLCMKLFFNKLLWVLRERESKTTLLAKEADDKMGKIGEEDERYRGEVEKAYSKAQKYLREKKDEIIHREDQRYKGKEAEMAKEVEGERAKIVAGVQAQKDSVLREADELAGALSQRLVEEK